MQKIKQVLTIKQPRIKLYLHIILSLTILIIISNIADIVWALSQTPPVSLVGPCEKTISLFDLKPEKTIYNNEIGYTIHYKYQDKFPSKNAFLQLERQLTECGWRQYGALEFMVNDVDWTSYLKGHSDEETVVVHRLGKTYIDKSRKRLALVLIRYISKPYDMKEAMQLNKPNNNMQLITLQFMPFNEEEYKKVLDKY